MHTSIKFKGGNVVGFRTIMLMFVRYIVLNFTNLAFYLNPLHLSKLSNAVLIKKVSKIIISLAVFPITSCNGRVVKALHLKSNGVSFRRFDSCSTSNILKLYLSKRFLANFLYSAKWVVYALDYHYYHLLVCQLKLPRFCKNSKCSSLPRLCLAFEVLNVFRTP